MNESYYRDALQRYRSEDTESLYLIIENEDSLTEEAVKAAEDALVERGHGIAGGESNEYDQSEGFSAEALKAAEDLFLDRGLDVDESESNECDQSEGSQLAANLPADKKPNIMAKQYKIEVVAEGALGTLLVGSSKLPVNKMEEVMNRYGAAGWKVNFIVIEKKRFLLFWQREAALITFEADC